MATPHLYPSGKIMALHSYTASSLLVSSSSLPRLQDRASYVAQWHCKNWDQAGGSGGGSLPFSVMFPLPCLAGMSILVGVCEHVILDRESWSKKEQAKKKREKTEGFGLKNLLISVCFPWEM